MDDVLADPNCWVEKAIASDFGDQDWQFFVRLPDNTLKKCWQSHLRKVLTKAPAWLEDFWNDAVRKPGDNYDPGEVVFRRSSRPSSSSSGASASKHAASIPDAEKRVPNMSASHHEPDTANSNGMEDDDFYDGPLGDALTPPSRTTPLVDRTPSQATIPSRRRRSSSSSSNDSLFGTEPPSKQSVKAKKQRTRELGADAARRIAEQLPSPEPEPEPEPEPQPIAVKARLGLRSAADVSQSPAATLRPSASQTPQEHHHRNPVLTYNKELGGLAELRYESTARSSRSISVRDITATPAEEEGSGNFDWDALFAADPSQDATPAPEPTPAPVPAPVLPPEELARAIAELPDFDEELPDFEDDPPEREITPVPEGPREPVVQWTRWKPPAAGAAPDILATPLAGVFKAPSAYTGHAERERFILDLVLPAQTIAACPDLQVGDYNGGDHSCRVKFIDFSDSPKELNDVLRDRKAISVDELRDNAVLIPNRRRIEEVMAGAGMCARIEVLDLPGQAKSRRLVHAVAEYLHMDDKHVVHATAVRGVHLAIFSSRSREVCDALRVPATLRHDPPALLISRLLLPL